MRCFFKHGKLVRQIILEPNANNEVKYQEGIYIFDAKSTFMYELDPKKNQYSPAAFWTVGNPLAHDFMSVNHGIPAGVLDALYSPVLFRLWIKAQENPLIIALLVFGIINFIGLIIVAWKVW